MEIVLIAIFIVGYGVIVSEHWLGINKAAPALIGAVILWTVLVLGEANHGSAASELAAHLGEISGILFFLLGAMTVVELIDTYHGFDFITNRIKPSSQRALLWTVSWITFFLSALLDNLTTTIVAVALLRKLIADPTHRRLFVGVAIIAANAGGAWSPIGDVSTTMLWIGGQLSAPAIIANLALPSLVALIVPLVLVSTRIQGQIERPAVESFDAGQRPPVGHQVLVFTLGVTVLLLVPIFKTVTHLPPFMGMLLGLGLVWLVTEILRRRRSERDHHEFTVAQALRRIDTPSILFFLGILLGVGALQTAGILQQLTDWLNHAIADHRIIAGALGLSSAIVDNVPLVAATQGMYGPEVFPPNHDFWLYVAYSTGTGGSALIIGSAAGVAAMGLEKISFGWYVRNLSLPAVLGFLSGFGTFWLQSTLIGRLAV